MESRPRLNSLERRVLLGIPDLFPDGDSDDLRNLGSDREAVSYALQHLIGLKLARASSHEGVHPFAPYFRSVELTTEGEELRRDLARSRLVRWLESEWKWLASTVIAVCALALSLFNFFHSFGM